MTASGSTASLSGFFLHVLIGKFQRENEFRADALRADDIDVLPVGVDDFFNDRKAETRTAAVLAAGVVALVEAVPDARNIALFDAAAVVFYGNVAAVVKLLRLDLDLGILIGKFDRIVKQVVKDLLDSFFIRIDEKLFPDENEADGDFLFPAASLEKGGCVFNDGLMSKFVFLRTAWSTSMVERSLIRSVRFWRRSAS